MDVYPVKIKKFIIQPSGLSLSIRNASPKGEKLTVRIVNLWKENRHLALPRRGVIVAERIGEEVQVTCKDLLFLFKQTLTMQQFNKHTLRKQNRKEFGDKEQHVQSEMKYEYTMLEKISISIRRNVQRGNVFEQN